MHPLLTETVARTILDDRQRMAQQAHAAAHGGDDHPRQPQSLRRFLPWFRSFRGTGTDRGQICTDSSPAC